MGSFEKSGNRVNGCVYTAGYNLVYDINQNIYKLRTYGYVTPIASSKVSGTYTVLVDTRDNTGSGEVTDNITKVYIGIDNKSFSFNPIQSGANMIFDTTVFIPPQPSNAWISVGVLLPGLIFFESIKAPANNTPPVISTIQSASAESCDITWSSNINLQSITIKIGNDVLKNITALNSTSGTTQITGLMPNANYTLTIIGKRYNSIITSTINKGITTSLFPTISSSLNFNIGDILNVVLSSKFSLNYFLKTTIYNSSGGILENNIPVSVTAQTVTLNSSSIEEDLHKLSANDKTLSIKIQPYYTAINYAGQSQTVYGSVFTGVAFVTNSSPTFLSFNCSNTDDKSLSILENNQYFIQGYGNLNVVIPKENRATGINYATIKKYVCELIKSTKDGQVIGTKDIPYYDDLDISLNFGALNTNLKELDYVYIKIHAVDSRGFISQSVIKSVSILPYRVPSVSFPKFSRYNEFEKEIIWNLESYYSSLPIDNINKNDEFKIEIRSYEVGTPPSGDYITLPDGDMTHTILNLYTNKVTDVRSEKNCLFQLEREKSYYVEFLCTDKLTSYTFIAEIPAGISVFEIFDDKHVTIGRLPDLESDCMLQVGSDILVQDNKGGEHELLKELTTQSSPLIKAMYLLMHPIGDIVMSANATNPSSIWGGTWVLWGSGRVPVGINTGDANFNTVEKTGGVSSNNFAHAHTVSSHTHGMTHSHTVNSHNHSTANHTLTTSQIPAHSHTLTRSISRCDSEAAGYGLNPASGFGGRVMIDSSSNPVRTTYSGDNGAHNHGNTGASAPGTNNSPANTGASAPETNNSLGSVNNLQPYITCYMWKRTA